MGSTLAPSSEYNWTIRAMRMSTASLWPIVSCLWSQSNTNKNFIIRRSRWVCSTVIWDHSKSNAYTAVPENRRHSTRGHIFSKEKPDYRNTDKCSKKLCISMTDIYSQTAPSMTVCCRPCNLSVISVHWHHESCSDHWGVVLPILWSFNLSC